MLNNKGEEQPAYLRRLVCVLVLYISKTDFLLAKAYIMASTSNRMLLKPTIYIFANAEHKPLHLQVVLVHSHEPEYSHGPYMAIYPYIAMNPFVSTDPFIYIHALVWHIACFRLFAASDVRRTKYRKGPLNEIGIINYKTRLQVCFPIRAFHRLYISVGI